jgi:hypothetical protein
VSTQDSWLGGGSSSILHTYAGPSWSSPAGVKPAAIMALYPVVRGFPAHPLSMSPPHGAKSTTTISPVVVLHSLIGSACAVPGCQTLPRMQHEPINATQRRDL